MSLFSRLSHSSARLTAWARLKDWINFYVTWEHYGPVRLAYQPYFFSEGTVFFSHGKSANNISFGSITLL
jgi:hypothetical protein